MRATKLYEKCYLSWRGKAGAYAKSKNKEMIILSNEQRNRYFDKWVNSAGFGKEFIQKLIENRYR